LAAIFFAKRRVALVTMRSTSTSIKLIKKAGTSSDVDVKHFTLLNCVFPATANEASIFPNSKIGRITRYPDLGPQSPFKTGSVMTVEFTLDGREFTVLVVGVLLGGTVGVGTLAFTFGIGPLVQIFLPRLALPPRRRAGTVPVRAG
jgi:hypothetical protein